MFASLPTHPLTSSRRRPGHTTRIRVGDNFCEKESCVARERTSPSNLLKPAVGPGLRRDDGLRGVVIWFGGAVGFWRGGTVR